MTHPLCVGTFQPRFPFSRYNVDNRFMLTDLILVQRKTFGVPLRFHFQQQEMP